MAMPWPAARFRSRRPVVLAFTTTVDFFFSPLSEEKYFIYYPLVVGVGVVVEVAKGKSGIRASDY